MKPIGFGGILKPFTNPAAYTSLINWDPYCLRPLYEFDQESRPAIKVNEIVSRIVRQVHGDEYVEGTDWNLGAGWILI